MLTTSPIIPSSSNASSASFHYAPTRSSPHSSPSRLSALPPRQHRSTPPASLNSPSLSRPSTATTAATSAAPTRHYVGVDASTQYSPMEPVNYYSPRASSLPANPPPPPHPMPLDPAKISQQTPQAAVAPAIREADGTTLSPGKRRGSPMPSPSQPPPATPASPSNMTKRPKTSPNPPKILPLRYETCGIEDMVVLISHMLAELIETNDALALRSGNLTRFHSRTAPAISVLEYLNRLAKHATLTPPLLLSMVYYIDRLCALYPDFTINTLTVHRFLITAATVAAKGLSDSFWNNTTYAKVGGVRVQELKLLELEFLYRVDWKIVPNPEVLVAYYRGLVERCPGYALQEDESSPGEDEDDELEDEEDEVYESDEQDDEGSSSSENPDPSGERQPPQEGSGVDLAVVR